MGPLQCAKAQPATFARMFLSIASRGQLQPRQTSILEVLIPRRFFHPPVAARPHAVSLRHEDRPPKRRFLSATATRYRTQCIHNPQRDAEDQEMMLELTPRAAKRLSDIMAKDTNPGLALRIQVESGGCHGFQYLMSLITLPSNDASNWAPVVGDEDTVFQYIADDADDATTTFDGPKVVVDQPSLDLLKGSKIDFTMELIGSQFKITDNPLATSSCGCGTSFDIKL